MRKRWLTITAITMSLMITACSTYNHGGETTSAEDAVNTETLEKSEEKEITTEDHDTGDGIWLVSEKEYIYESHNKKEDWNQIAYNYTKEGDDYVISFQEKDMYEDTQEHSKRYDKNGKAISSDEAAYGETLHTEYQYDDQGRVEKIIMNNGYTDGSFEDDLTIFTYEYDSEGNVTEYFYEGTDENCRTWLALTVTKKDAGGKILSETSYDEKTDPEGEERILSQYANTYDEYGMMLTHENHSLDNGDQFIEATVEKKEDMITYFIPEGEYQTSRYETYQIIDGQLIPNHLLSLYEGETEEEKNYDENGNLIRYLDSTGGISIYTYKEGEGKDALLVQYDYVNKEDHYTASFTYDEAGNPTQFVVTDPDNTKDITDFSYEDGRLVTIIKTCVDEDNIIYHRWETNYTYTKVDLPDHLLMDMADNPPFYGESSYQTADDVLQTERQFDAQAILDYYYMDMY